MRKPILFFLLCLTIFMITGCEKPILFDGLYRAKEKGPFNYLRFYSDGTVLAASLTGNPQDIIRWFDKDNIFAKGYYQISGTHVKFSIMDSYSKFDYEGVITRKKIRLTVNNHLNDDPIHQMYRFISLPIIPDYSENHLKINEMLTPDPERIIVRELQKDIDSDGKLERIVFDDDKEEHTRRPDEYTRVLIYNAHNYLVFDSERAGVDIAGVKIKDALDYLVVEDKNLNGIPEIYLQEKQEGNLPGRIAIIESDQTSYHVLVFNHLGNYEFVDLDSDGKPELYGETGSSAWQLLNFTDRTVFKLKGFKYIPLYELTWQQVDKEQSMANENFINNPNFDNLLRLITLDAVLGLREEGLRLVKENIDLKDSAGAVTLKNLNTMFDSKIEYYNAYWRLLKSRSEWYNLTEQIDELYQQKRYDDAMELAAKSENLAKEVFGADHIHAVVSMQNLAILNLYLGKNNEAAVLFKESAATVDSIVRKETKSFWNTPYRSLWSDQDFKLASISLGMQETAVFKAIGQPIAKKGGTMQWGDFPEALFQDFLYKGITVRFIQTDKNEGFKVRRLVIKSPRYSTMRGVKVGDSYKKVLLCYGEPIFQNQSEIEYQFMYSMSQANYWKRLTFKLNPKGNVDIIIVGPVYESI